jgi:hypothetical protein
MITVAVTPENPEVYVAVSGRTVMPYSYGITPVIISVSGFNPSCLLYVKIS